MNVHNYDDLRKKAEKVLKQKGSNQNLDYLSDVEKLVEELNIYQIELEMQNHELHASNEKLEQERKKYLELYIQAPVAYITLNNTGNIIQLNEAAAELFGLPIHRFKYTSIFPYLAQESKNEFVKHFKELFNSRLTHYGEIIFINAQNKKVFTKLNTQCYFDQEMGEMICRCAITDVTALKYFERELELQRKLNESEIHFKILFDNVSDFVFYQDFNTGNIITANETAKKVYGYSEEDFTQMKLSQLNTSTPLEVIQQRVATLQNEGFVSFETTHTTKVGKQIPVEVKAKKIDDNTYISVARDISERKKAEEILKTEREQFLSLLNTIPEPIYVSDLESYEILFANDAQKEIYGETILGQKCFNAFYGFDQKCDFCQNHKLQMGENEIARWENYDSIHKKSFLNIEKIIRWNDNKKARFQISFDITQQKEAQLQIEQLNQRLETSLAAGNMAWWEMYLPSGKTLFSENKTKMLGFDAADFSHYHDFMNLVHPDDYEPTMQAMRQYFLGEKDIYQCEYRIRNKDNEYLWYYDIGQIVEKNNNETKLTGIVLNVSDRKNAEKILKDSEEKFRKVVEHLPHGLVQIDSKGLIVEWNQAMEKITGMQQPDLAGETFWNTSSQLVPNEEHKSFIYNYLEKEIKKAIQTGNADWLNKTITSSYRNTRNEIRTVEATHFLIPTERGNQLGAIIQDITERVAIQNALKESEERFKKLSNLTFEGIVLHKNGIAIDVNEALEKMLGYEPNELVGKNLIQLVIHPSDHKRVIDNIIKDIAIPYEVIGIRKNGTAFWAELEARNIQYGEEIFRVAAVRNISERKKAEVIIQNQNKELIKLNTDKDRFMQILAHDLKNPFNSLIGFTDLLLKNFKKYDDEKIEKHLTILNEVSLKTYNLLEELLLWSKSQSGKLPFEPQEIDFMELCQEVLSVLQQTANKKNIQVNCFETEKIILWCDVNMFKTILRNLISNAIKFTNAFGNINIYAEVEDNQAIITVSDNGIGIPEEVIPKLWEITTHQTTQGTQGESGTGLGLFICKDFVEQHDGTIWVESKINKGSEFKFTIPLK